MYPTSDFNDEVFISATISKCSLNEKTNLIAAYSHNLYTKLKNDLFKRFLRNAGTINGRKIVLY